MFTRLFVAVLPLALFVAAQDTTVNQCNTGEVSCCNQVQDLDQSHQDLFGDTIFKLAAQVGGQVGINCSPISVIGVGSSCDVSQQPVCCSNNNFNGVVNVGCTPISIEG